MKNKRLHIFNSIIFSLLLIFNIWIYINRDNGFAYTDFLSYNQIYQAKETKGLVKSQFNGNDSISFIFSPKMLGNTWDFYLNNKLMYSGTGIPSLKLAEGINNYRLTDVKSKKNIDLKLNYVGQLSYQKSGRTRVSDVELMYSSVPIISNNTFNTNHWVQSSEYTTNTELQTVKQILKDSINITANESTISKINKIGSYIIKNIGHTTGMPSDSLDLISPMRQFILAKENKAQIWCGTYVSIFSLFANTANIPTRSVWIEGSANGILTAGHNLNECYIKETEEWMMVDLMNNILTLKTQKNKLLNVIDFYNLHMLNVNDIVVSLFINDSIKQLSYNTNNSTYNNYFSKQTQFMYYYSLQYKTQLYSVTNKTKRYLCKQPTFGLYAGTNVYSNKKFYIKQAAFCLLAIFAIYWFLLAFIIKRKLNN